jgi:hypothetical protein
MAPTQPYVRSGLLLGVSADGRGITVDTDVWYRWLEHASSERADEALHPRLCGGRRHPVWVHGPSRLQSLIASAPSLADYQRSLPRSLRDSANLPLSATYSTRRARPRRLEAGGFCITPPKP